MPNIAEQPIYLVDQDDVVRDSLKVLLESHGLGVRDFRDAGDFLKAARPTEGGCVVLGFNRNIVDGLDLLEALRKLGWNLPVIFIVGGGSAPMKASAHAAGAFAYLERPVQEAALIRAVRDALAPGAGNAAPAGRTSPSFAPSHT